MKFKRFKVGRVIEVLRRKYPQYKWRYNSKTNTWTCGAGYAHWVCSMYDDDDFNSWSSLYFYPHSGTPVQVM